MSSGVLLEPASIELSGERILTADPAADDLRGSIAIHGTAFDKSGDFSVKLASCGEDWMCSTSQVFGAEFHGIGAYQEHGIAFRDDYTVVVLQLSEGAVLAAAEGENTSIPDILLDYRENAA